MCSLTRPPPALFPVEIRNVLCEVFVVLVHGHGCLMSAVYRLVYRFVSFWDIFRPPDRPPPHGKIECGRMRERQVEGHPETLASHNEKAHRGS